jgi:hypothetical protein
VLCMPHPDLDVPNPCAGAVALYKHDCLPSANVHASQIGLGPDGMLPTCSTVLEVLNFARVSSLFR